MASRPGSATECVAATMTDLTPEPVEWTFEMTRVMDYSALRDNVAPAFRRDFPGVIVEVDECVIYTDIPDQEWLGGRITVIGLEERTAGMIAASLKWYSPWHQTIREVTDAEKIRLMEWRQS